VALHDVLEVKSFFVPYVDPVPKPATDHVVVDIKASAPGEVEEVEEEGGRERKAGEEGRRGGYQ
jgi:hypothetical protein